MTAVSNELCGFNEMNGNFLDQHDLLSGHVVLLQNPLELSHAGQCCRVLHRVNDQMDVMVNDRLIRVWWEPRASPGWRIFQVGMRQTAETVVKELMKKNLLCRRKHCLAQPGREARS